MLVSTAAEGLFLAARNRTSNDAAADCGDYYSKQAHWLRSVRRQAFDDLRIADNNLTTCAMNHNSPQSRQN